MPKPHGAVRSMFSAHLCNVACSVTLAGVLRDRYIASARKLKSLILKCMYKNVCVCVHVYAFAYAHVYVYVYVQRRPRPREARSWASPERGKKKKKRTKK